MSSQDLSGHIGGTAAGNNFPRKSFNNKVDLSNEFDTLDEPIIDTIVGNLYKCAHIQTNNWFFRIET